MGGIKLESRGLMPKGCVEVSHEDFVRVQREYGWFRPVGKPVLIMT